MTLDPDEGLDADGFLVTGAARERVPAAYEPVLADAVAELGGDRVHGLYVYGSVATGRARPPSSDVDLLVLATEPVDVSSVRTRLSTRYAALAREVAPVVMTLQELRAGVADQAFLRHYCVLLAGTAVGLPRFRPSRALVEGFSGDLHAAIDGWLSTLDGRGAARALLLAAATRESLAHGGWTTDRATAARLVRAHHPEWTSDVDRAVRWTTDPPDPGEVPPFLDGFGRWLADSGCLDQP